MKTLKAKFGKFAISNEKIAKITGGLTCYANGGKTVKHNLKPEDGLQWCAARPSCYGCF